MPDRSSNYLLFLFAVILAVSLNFYSWHLPFFWDTILTSTVSQYFYEQGFHHFIIPAIYDAGHPPLFYIYVTLFFKIFGRSLWAAHLSMLPFTVLGIVSFVSILRSFKFTDRQQLFGIVLFFSIPAVITQYMLVSYDAVLLSLYLAALAAFLANKRFLFSVLIIGLAGISLRGIFCIASLSVTIFFLKDRKLKPWLQWNLRMLPAIVLALAWYVYHYTQTGWFISTPNSGWKGQRGMVNAFGWIKNCFSIARCFADLGMIWISGLALYYIVKKKRMDRLMQLSLIPFIVFSLSFLPFTNPVNHRYYLVVYVLLIPLVIQLLSGKKIIYHLLSILLILSGHFQIYPAKISNGWDCTLVHLDYFPLRQAASAYIKQHNISKQQLGSVFPMIASSYQTDLTDDRDRIMNVNGEEMDSLPFILYSNVGNDFSDDQLIRLEKWKPVWKDKKGLVSVILYQNPDFPLK